MKDVTLHQIKTYYERYREVDITFNKKVMEFLKVMPKEIYLKCKDYIYPCIINSASMTCARIIAQVNTLFFERVNTNNKIVHLRLAFKGNEDIGLISFFILSKMEEYVPIDSRHPDLYFIDLKYTQHPPNDLVLILGQLVEAGSLIKKRKNERITITPRALRMLKIKNAQAILVMNSKKQKCLLRDLSLSGAKVIIAGEKREYENQKVHLVIQSNVNQLLHKIPGTVLRCEEIKGQTEFIALAIRYIDGEIPSEYNKIILDFISKQRAVDSLTQKN